MIIRGSGDRGTAVFRYGRDFSLIGEITLIVDNNLAASGKRSGPLNSLNWGMSAEVRSPQTIIVSLKTQASMGHGIRSG